MQGFYQSVWDRVSAGFDLPNTVSENVQWDTAMAVAWLYDGLPVGAPVDFNYVASFADATVGAADRAARRTHTADRAGAEAARARAAAARA